MTRSGTKLWPNLNGTTLAPLLLRLDNCKINIIVVLTSLDIRLVEKGSF